jgi:hypothetical protein
MAEAMRTISAADLHQIPSAKRFAQTVEDDAQEDDASITGCRRRRQRYPRRDTAGTWHG